MFIWSNTIFHLVSLPGVFVHVCAQEMICRLFFVPVDTVHYFSPSHERLGMVAHEEITGLFRKTLVVYGPFFVCFVLGLILFTSGAYYLAVLQGGGPLDFVSIGLGGSILYQSVPHFEDVVRVHRLWSNKSFYTKVFTFPIFILNIIFRFPLIRFGMLAFLGYMFLQGVERSLPFISSFLG